MTVEHVYPKEVETLRQIFTKNKELAESATADDQEFVARALADMPKYAEMLHMLISLLDVESPTLEGHDDFSDGYNFALSWVRAIIWFKMGEGK